MRFRARCRRLAQSAAVAALAVAAAPPALADHDLRHLVETLAARHGFVLEGAERLDGESAHHPDRPLHDQLVRLLRDYDFVIVVAPDGGVRRVTVIGSLAAAARDRGPAADAGSGRFAESFVIGPNGTQRLVAFELETSLSTPVLPLSMMPALGFDEANTQAIRMTLRGELIEGRMGLLPTMAVDGREIRNVGVAFVADDRIGGRNLIGKPVLERLGIRLPDPG